LLATPSTRVDADGLCLYAVLYMSNLDRRGNYTPRHVREKRAYRLATVGAGAGGLGVITLVLSVVGIVSFGIPVILLIIAALCAYGFMRTTGKR
jgi:hypothetical protein